ncbi:MAG: patatin-like phospholipase family protein [Rhodobacter sp.]|nr:patatin-like phospholipase family protein [Paracoccaceae bacterium]MCC0076409.1 patatin-like phospholipase family protein [Rhodobacter sp.]
MAKPVIGLALGSGGARGWCHIGVLRELSAMGIEAEVVAGSSMGALVGAAHAAGRLGALEDWARGLTLRAMLALIDMRIAGGGLVGGEGILTMLRGLDLPETIEELALPFVATATDLRRGREIWLRKGDLVQSVRASVSIPGLFRPQWLDGRWLVDGGVLNPVPVSAARALGADVVIGVNPNAAVSGAYWEPGQDLPGFPDLSSLLPEKLRGLWADDRPDDVPEHTEPSYVALVNATIDIMSDQIRRSRLAGEPPQVLLNARLGGVSVVDFHRAAECIDEGRRMVQAQADHLAQSLGL